MCTENDDVELVSKVNDMILKAVRVVSNEPDELWKCHCHSLLLNWPLLSSLGCKSDQEKPKDKQQQHNWRCFKRSVHSKAHQRQMTQHFVGLDKREKLDATTKKVLMTYNAQNHQKRKKKKACLELSCIKYN